MPAEIYEIFLPEYRVDEKPNSYSVGRKVDAFLKGHFMNHEIVLRGVGTADHKDKTAGELITIILETGTDRCDPGRKGDRYENIENRHIDFFALNLEVTPEADMTAHMFESFYSWPLKTRGYPVRVDILTLYNPAHIECVTHTYKDGRIKNDGFVFKNRKNAHKAVRAVIKLLPWEPHLSGFSG